MHDSVPTLPPPMPVLVFTNHSLLFFHLSSEAASVFLKTVIQAPSTSWEQASLVEMSIFHFCKTSLDTRY